MNIDMTVDPDRAFLLDLDPITATDDGNALWLVVEHGHGFRRVADMRRWFCWDGTRWAQDQEDRTIREAARELARQLPDGSKEEKTVKRNSMSAIGISGCVRVAETDPRVSILATELDSHPELIAANTWAQSTATATDRQQQAGATACERGTLGPPHILAMS